MAIRIGFPERLYIEVPGEPEPLRLTYRRPTAAERLEYAGRLLAGSQEAQAKAGVASALADAAEVVSRLAAQAQTTADLGTLTMLQIEFGRRLIVGIDPGQVVVPGPGGEDVPLITDPKADGYTKDWPDLLEEHYSWLLQAVGRVALSDPLGLAMTPEQHAKLVEIREAAKAETPAGGKHSPAVH